MKALSRLLAKLNIFRNMRITTKMTLVTIVLLFGFTAIAGAFLYRQQIIDRIRLAEAELLALTEANDEVQSGVLLSEAALKEYFLGQAPSARSTFLSAMNQVNNATADLEKAAQNDRQETVIVQMRDAIGRYQRAAVAAIKAFQADAGEEGPSARLSAAADGMEALLTQQDASALQVSLLTMRRHEQAFVQHRTEAAADLVTQERKRFDQLLASSALPASTKAQLAELSTTYGQAFQDLVALTQEQLAAVASADEQEALVNPLVSSMNKVATQTAYAVRSRGQAGEAQIQQINTAFLTVLAIVAAVVTFSLVSLAVGIGRSLRHLNGAVRQVAEGNLDARAAMTSKDELGQFGRVLDNMLDERLTDLARQARENEQLNNSVIDLMDAADRLSKRDLTVVLPVGEDITGNVSDALNQMTRQTARTMSEINGVAAQLEQVANAVRDQNDKVGRVSANERKVVAETLESLEQSAATMEEIAGLATTTNSLADTAMLSGKKALASVRTTVQSMGEIRSSIGETEKSIKRLGERSQEIGAIVEIIKDIAERTHTLALNAGMQAVAAGEAGRGFSVVADEVQRLAETARDSTNQINTLVHSIQAESSESMATMNETIKQVVQGSDLAERAGKRMRITQKSTHELVAAVGHIAERARLLETTNKALQQQAAALQESTEATEQELKAQAEQTTTMFRFLQSLVQSVRVFKLPEAA